METDNQKMTLVGTNKGFHGLIGRPGKHWVCISQALMLVQPTNYIKVWPPTTRGVYKDTALHIHYHKHSASSFCVSYYESTYLMQRNNSTPAVILHGIIISPFTVTAGLLHIKYIRQIVYHFIFEYIYICTLDIYIYISSSLNYTQ